MQDKGHMVTRYRSGWWWRGGKNVMGQLALKMKEVSAMIQVWHAHAFWVLNPGPHGRLCCEVGLLGRRTHKRSLE